MTEEVPVEAIEILTSEEQRALREAQARARPHMSPGGEVTLGDLAKMMRELLWPTGRPETK